MTPGPWEVVEKSDTFNIKAGNRCIARLQKKAGAKGDARLIALAPDMLALCESMLALEGDCPWWLQELCDEANRILEESKS